MRPIALLLIVALLAAVTSSGYAGQARAATQHSSVAVKHVQSQPAAFDKTRFVAHLAVAAFLVHYIYKKYKQGKLGRHHLFTSVKAGIAALLAYHEMKKAYTIAQSSNSKTLHVLISPMTKLTSTLSAMSSKLKRGDTSDIDSANSQENLLQSSAKSTPYAFKDQQPAGGPGF